jgi:SH3 domain protein
MMKKPRCFLILFFFLCLTGPASWAAGTYVSDSFEVIVRTGPSTENKILSMPASGQAVEVLETKGDWSRVRLSVREGGSVEGWMLNRYLITRLPWELQARTAKEENAALKEKLSRIGQERNDLQHREKDLSGKLEAATVGLQKLHAEYDSFKKGAADFVKLKKDLDTARSELESTRSTLEAISEENRVLKASERNRWIMTGAGVLLCGLVIGLVMGRKEKRRRSLYS